MIIDILGIFYFIPAYIWFLLTNKTPKLAYKFHRRYFVRTSGKYNDFLSNLYARFVGKYEVNESNGILGKLGNQEIKEIVNGVRDKGYFVFNQQLPNSVINSVYQYFKEEPCKYLDINDRRRIAYSTSKVKFDEENIISPRYQYEGNQVLKNEHLKAITLDENFLHIAQEYLKVKPILDSSTLWWSAPFMGKGANQAAQMYHHDQDRLKFLKFFFYFTDVDEDNGPHCYVPYSHKSIPKGLRRDGRFTEEEIEKYYGIKGDEIGGKAGTILAVDTRGLHKGKELVKRHRLLFQIQFTNSLFGQPNIGSYQLSKSSTKVLTEKKQKYSRSYKLFSIA